MRVLVITPPDPVVTWDDADAHLKLSGDETDKTYVEGLIAAATAHLDGPDGWLGRALGEQVLEARFSASDGYDRVRLPFPPLISLISATYRDAANTDQTANLSDLEIFGSELAALATWPWQAGSYRQEAVRVRYLAGYPDAIPAPIRIAILMMVGDMYRNRVTTQPGAQAAVPMSSTVENLLAPFRVFF